MVGPPHSLRGACILSRPELSYEPIWMLDSTHDQPPQPPAHHHVLAKPALSRSPSPHRGAAGHPVLRTHMERAALHQAHHMADTCVMAHTPTYMGSCAAGRPTTRALHINTCSPLPARVQYVCDLHNCIHWQKLPEPYSPLPRPLAFPPCVPASGPEVGPACLAHAPLPSLPVCRPVGQRSGLPETTAATSLSYTASQSPSAPSREVPEWGWAESSAAALVQGQSMRAGRLAGRKSMRAGSQAINDGRQAGRQAGRQGINEGRQAGSQLQRLANSRG